MKMLRNVFLGIKRDYKKAGFLLISSVALLWSVIEPIVAFTEWDVKGSWKLLMFSIVACVIAIWNVYPKKQIEIKLKKSKFKIKIKFGDLFEEIENIGNKCE